jgi:pimeloyl-ACP methyl ester carboxylesterase
MGTPLRMRFQRIPRILKLVGRIRPPPWFKDGVSYGRLPQPHTERDPHRGALYSQLQTKHGSTFYSTSAPPRRDLSPFTCHRLLSRCVSVFSLLFVQISPRSATGNAGNPLHRIPVFTTLLDAIPSLAIFAPAPRSYWTSSDAARPTQAGLTADYTAALAFAASRFPTSRLTIYGHSLGASIALCLLASHTDVSKAAAMVHGLVLENAFSNMPDMLRVLYPQRWLP